MTPSDPAGQPDDSGGSDNAPTPGQIRSGKLAGRTMTSAILVLALPVLLEQFSNACVGLVDQMLAGHLPDAIARPALDGLGIGTYFQWFINIAISAIGIGAGALVARGMGAGDRELTHSTLGQAVTLSVIWGAFIAGVMWLAAPPLAGFLGFTPAAAGYFIEYVRVLALGMPVTSLMMVGMNCLHGAGETTRPFLIMLVVNAVNIIASWWLAGVTLDVGGLVLESPMQPGLHVTGIALGTVAGRAVGAVLMLALMLRGVADLRLEWRRLAPRRAMLWRIARIGIPGFAESVGLWMANILLLGVLGMVAADRGGIQGAHAIAIRWESFAFLPGFAMGVAASALVGQYLGAGNPRQATRALWICTGIGAAFMGICGVGFMVFGEVLTAVISTDPVHMAVTPELLDIGGVVMVPFGVAMVLRVALRGVGDTRMTMVISWTMSWGLRLPGAWFAGVILGGGITGMWIAMSAEIVLRACIFVARGLHGGWRNVTV